jgi:hypothetical protein
VSANYDNFVFRLVANSLGMSARRSLPDAGASACDTLPTWQLIKLMRPALHCVWVLQPSTSLQASMCQVVCAFAGRKFLPVYGCSQQPVAAELLGFTLREACEYRRG